MLAPRRDETPLHYVISFWPTAPLFGVPWRFEAMMPTAKFFRPTAVMAQMAEASANETARAVEESAQKAAEIVEVVARTVAESAAAVVEVAAAARTVEAFSVVGEDAEPAFADAPVEDATDEDAPDAAIAETAAGPDAAAAAATPPATLFDTPPTLVDDLKLIKGVGPKLEATLNGLGIYRFDQIARFTEADLAWVEANLQSFRGRALREDWVAQARALLAGA